MNLRKSQILWVLFIISFSIYIPTLNNGFTLDDAIVLTENSFTQSADIINIFTKDTFAGYFSEKASLDLVAGGRYRPLSLVIFSAIWKISSEPFIYHLINVLCYAFTVIMVFLLMFQLMQERCSDKNKNTLTSGLIAVIFALHPVHTEVVNNIKSLDEILSLLLGLAAWMILLKAKYNLTLWTKISVTLLFLMALLAKETAVVLLPIIGVSILVLQNKSLLYTLKQLTPIFLGLLIYLIMRHLALGDVSIITDSTEPLNNPFLKYINNQWVPFTWSEKFGTILYSLGYYLVLLVMPINLTHDYYPQVIPMTSLISTPAILSLAIHLVLLYLSVTGLIKKRWYGFGLAIYLIAISLFSNTFLTIGTLMAERFLYVPSLGFAVVLAWLLLLPIKFNQSQVKTKPKPNSMTVWLSGIVLALAIGYSGYKIIDRSKDWHSNFALFQADIQRSFRSAKLQNALGGELVVQSQLAQTKGSKKESLMLHQAIQHLDQAISLHPTYSLAFMLKGNALHYSGQHQSAIEQFNKALAINPEFTDAKKNLRSVLAHIENKKTEDNIKTTEQQAQKFSESGQHIEAIKLFSELIDQTHSSKHYFFRGITYANNNQLELALNDFLQAEKASNVSDRTNRLRILKLINNTYKLMGKTDLADLYQLKIDRLNSFN